MSFLFTVTSQELQDVQLSLFLPTVRMLLTVTQASPAACSQVVTVVSYLTQPGEHMLFKRSSLCLGLMLFLTFRSCKNSTVEWVDEQRKGLTLKLH
jgi:hypothetical protein